MTATAPARHRSFAAQLSGARRREARTSPVERALRRAHHSSSRTLHVGLSLALHVAAAARRAPPGAAPALPAVLRADGVRVVERLRELQRSFTTRVREYRDAHPEPVASHTMRTVVRERVERAGAFPAAQMTVVHRREAAARATADVARAEPAASIRSQATRPGAASRVAQDASFVLPVQELSRVTDHVLEQLDRRVLSYRERQGRV